MEINRQKFSQLILYSLAYLVLLRTSSMGFGYPSAEYLLSRISFTPQKLMQMLALLLLALFIFVNGWASIKWFKISTAVYLLMLGILLSIANSEHSLLALRFLISMLAITLPLYVFYRFYGSYALYRVWLNFAMACIIINFLYVLAFPQYGIMSANHAGAWRGLFVHKNMAGSFFALTSCLLYFEAFYYQRSKFNVYSLLFALSCLFVLLAHSTTAIFILLGCIGSFQVMMLVTQLSSSRAKLWLLIGYASILTAGYTLLTTYLEDILAFFGKDPSLTGRTGLWDVLVQLSFDKPILGYGLGIFHRPEIMLQFSSEFGWEAKSTHSSYVDIILGVGYPTSILFLGLLIRAAVGALLTATPSSQHANFLAMIVAIMVGVLLFSAASSGAMLGNGIVWLLLFSSLLICNSISKMNKAPQHSARAVMASKVITNESTSF
ncbi:O-antigen ligase family protein [Agarivorans sp.]|uniref:O-antigen ligase family protein n=1 Tax=Agarivorans sp. TaxID=1872412 RepID=UPI003D02E753